MKQITLIILFSSLYLTVFGQEKNSKLERIEAKKIAFISSELDLTPVEAESFWPIYNEYQDHIKNRRSQNDLRATRKRLDDMSEAEADEFLENLLNREQLNLEDKRNFTQRLKSVLPSVKIAKLYFVEKQFKAKLVNRIKRNMKNRNK